MVVFSWILILILNLVYFRRFYFNGNIGVKAYYNPWFLNFESVFFRSCRNYYWRKCGVRCDNTVYFSHNLKVISPSNLTIKRNSKVLNGCIIDARGGVSIGSNTLLGFESMILSSSHVFSDVDLPVNCQGMSYKEVVIGDKIWIGTRSVILYGSSIGNSSIVGAMSLVNKRFNEYVILGGIPAKILRHRK